MACVYSATNIGTMYYKRDMVLHWGLKSTLKWWALSIKCVMDHKIFPKYCEF